MEDGLESHLGESTLQVVIMTRLYSGGGVGLEYPETSVHVAPDRMSRRWRGAADDVEGPTGPMETWPCLTGKHWDNAFSSV